MGVGPKCMDNKSDKELDDLVNGDAFCVLPWIHMHPWPDGRVFTCCLSEHDTPVGNLNEQTLEEVYNSETMKKFRTAMLDNKKISMLEIPTGNPLLINLNSKQEITECKYLDKDRAKDLLIFY